MLIRSLTVVLILISSFVLISAQTTEVQKTDLAKPSTPPVGVVPKRLRDLPFPGGVDLQFIIKELARDLELNVLFELESFRGPGRKTFIDLKNVASADALDLILAQEGLFLDPIGPKAILVASQTRRLGRMPEIGVGFAAVSGQLARYFGVDRGLLIDNVRDDSPASKAGLKAGDVITEVDGVPVSIPIVLFNILKEKNFGPVVFKIARDRQEQTISIAPEKGADAILNR